MFIEVWLLFSILPIIENRIYLYDTEESSSVEFYDCIHHNNLLYCRRPLNPITLLRNNETWKCYHDGILHSFASLLEINISVNFILHNWKSSIEKAEHYSRYIQNPSEARNENENYLCQCSDPQSFGKYCEYMLPTGKTFEETLDWEIEMHKEDENKMQLYGDILCYITLVCDSGLLCLDWRDICDTIQQCMLGYDEENCDKLEFNECDDNEYRCMNGMCIPDEYFLDGEYDCMDMTDEMGKSMGQKCAFQQASLECDDRMCYAGAYSCGDGECIEDRLAFQKPLRTNIACTNYRDQYFMCELDSFESRWTLSNNKCSFNVDSKIKNVLNHNGTEECIYLLKCALSLGAEKNCPYKNNNLYMKHMKNYCPQSYIQYPGGAIITPYTTFLYNWTRDFVSALPDFIEINATIKCRGYMLNHYMVLPHSTELHIYILENLLCMSSRNNSKISSGGYDQFCYNDSRTFNNQSYKFIDICNHSKECISAYRIRDGFIDCMDQMDEKNEQLVVSTCSKIQHHRFRCSAKELTCLSITGVNDGIRDCDNGYDEQWMGTGLLLSSLTCNSRSKQHCEVIRQYVKNSWNNDISSPQFTKNLLPFRAYCDTFWDLKTYEDEDAIICQEWWICLAEQWQCRTGQCIDATWILDEEWDCSDASDEEGILFTNHSLSAHNLRILNHFDLEEKFQMLFGDKPFWNICNFTSEFPCFSINFSSSETENIREKFCISLEKIGDGHIDCFGGLDERNVQIHCYDNQSMLGYDFKCVSSEACIAFQYICTNRCPNITDDALMCSGYMDSSTNANEYDFICWNGTYIPGGKCDNENDCLYGEDEYYCRIPNFFEDIFWDGLYRSQKAPIVRNIRQKLNLPIFPISANAKQTTIPTLGNFSKQRKSIVTKIANHKSSRIAFECNRGIGIYMHNDSIVCFCPQQYYGDRCQYHSDRVTIILHLNLSQSNYTESTKPSIILKMLVLFLFEDQILGTNEFHVRPAIENISPKKEIIHFLYSRSNESLYEKRKRYFNRSNIIEEHPYSIRIEAYELNVNQTSQIIAVWKYPIYFDYLPSFRLAKILHLTKLKNVINPCSKNPCKQHYQCHQLLNEQLDYICMCPNNFKGNDCTSFDQSCNTGFCSPNALCKPDYRSLLNGNRQPYCICPLGRYGYRCELIYDQCNPNPCQNQGTCLPSGKWNQYYCMCVHPYYGKTCELSKKAITLYINENIIEYRAIVIQYFEIEFFTLDLILIKQNVFSQLPEVLHFSHSQIKAPEIIIAKQYSTAKPEIYIISLQINVTSINTTTQITEINRCITIHMLFPMTEEIFPYKYHHLCMKNHSLFCFFDNTYLCICDQNHTRVECFGYDHQLDQCSSCFANGVCLKGDHSKANDFLCLCSRCHYGTLCQFNSDGLSSTLDSLIIQISHEFRIVYFVLTLLIFLIGGITNYASFITFKRRNLRKSSVCIYLLILSLSSQCSLFLLTLKMVIILFDSLMNDILCKIISYMLSVSIRYAFWLTSWVAIERVCFVLFPFATLFNKPRTTMIRSFLTLFIVAGISIHELIFYIKDPSGQNACVINFPLKIITYDRITVLIHYLTPFCIQIVSITILIIQAARIRSRSRKSNNDDTFIQYLKQQFKSHKELYITPTIIVFSGLPQIILSFSFACIKLATWQQHALLIAYFLSYAPQLLGLILFVFPSTNYIKEFRETNLSKTFIFRHLIFNTKRQ